MTTVWEPDDGYQHGQLSKAELRWLANKAQEAPTVTDEPDETVPDQQNRQPDKEKARG